MPPRQIYASSLGRRERTWSRHRRRHTWLPLWAIVFSAALTQALRVLA